MVALTQNDSVSGTPVPPAQTPASLVYCGRPGERPPVVLERPLTVIGSKPQCHVHLASREVSGCHALVLNTGGRLYLRDLNSRTQVRHNGAAVREAYLRDGDRLGVGPFEFDVSLPPSSDAGRTRVRRRRPRPLSLIVEGGPVSPVRLNGPIFLVGRRSGADLRIPDDRVSVAHAALADVDGEWELIDLNSRFGTVLNGQKVTHARLGPGDHISVGGVNLRVLEEPAPARADPADRLFGPDSPRPAADLPALVTFDEPCPGACPAGSPTQLGTAPASDTAALHAHGAATSESVGNSAVGKPLHAPGESEPVPSDTIPTLKDKRARHARRAPASDFASEPAPVEVGNPPAPAAHPVVPTPLADVPAAMPLLARPAMAPTPSRAGRVRDGSGRAGPASPAPEEIKFQDWGPLAAAVANPHFLESWGASRRQPMLPAERVGGWAADGLSDDQNAAARRPGRWTWIAAAAFILIVAVAAIAFGYHAGWLQRWIPRAYSVAHTA